MSLFVDIEKRLGDFELKMSFEAENGVTALLGESGCGKSMTLKCIAGLEKPDRGRIVLDGEVLFDSEKKICVAPRKRGVGYLFQNYALFPNMTVRQNIACGARHRGGTKQEVDELIRLMRLEGLEDRKPSELSGGQQQRTALARILVSRPRVLLLDEPFSALDAHLRFALEGELRGVLKEFAGPVMLVSHDRDEVFRLSGKVALVQAGSVQRFGTKKEVFEDPGTVYGASLTGCKNIFAAEALGEGRVYVGSLSAELEIRTVDESRSADALAEPIAAPEYVGIRMHDVKLAEQTGVNVLECTVTDIVENPFSFTVFAVPVGGTENVGVELSKDGSAKKIGDKVFLELPKEKLLLLKEGIKG